MKVFGVIIEANPLHNGHLYLIEQIKTNYHPDLLICVTSGNFTMRGEISVLPKYEKSKLLLQSGFDIVIELPVYSTLNSSSKFAKSSINLLNKMLITDLVFGIEKTTINEITQIIDYENNSNWDHLFKQNLNIEKSYKKAYSKTLLEISNNSFLSELSLLPNITLGLEYAREVINNYKHIKIHTINRIGSSDNSLDLNGFPSGSALREAIYNKKNIANFLNYSDEYLSNINFDKLNTLFSALALKKNNYYHDFLLIDEGIENYIIKNYDSHKNFQDNINSLANKKYTKSRIRRTLLSMLLELPKEINEDLPLRILGFNKNGEKYLKLVKNNKCFSSIKNNNSIYSDIELKASKLYDLLTNSQEEINEYKYPRKE